MHVCFLNTLKSWMMAVTVGQRFPHFINYIKPYITKLPVHTWQQLLFPRGVSGKAATPTARQDPDQGQPWPSRVVVHVMCTCVTNVSWRNPAPELSTFPFPRLRYQTGTVISENRPSSRVPRSQNCRAGGGELLPCYHQGLMTSTSCRTGLQVKNHLEETVVQEKHFPKHFRTNSKD